jgi:hyperosmotically inducible periplasmic protein
MDKKWLSSFVFAFGLVSSFATAVVAADLSPSNVLSHSKKADLPETALSPMEVQIRKQLITLPFISIYDHLLFQVKGNTVILSGDTIRPTIKSGAERVVAQLEGVDRVINQINVLPLSPFDNRIRLATTRAIYAYGPLNRYALGANPTIRVIVENGHIRLEGFVASEMDRNLAYVRAMGVSGAFSVTNNLRIG